MDENINLGLEVGANPTCNNGNSGNTVCPTDATPIYIFLILALIALILLELLVILRQRRKFKERLAQMLLNNNAREGS
jgi:hypothetical protein